MAVIKKGCVILALLITKYNLVSGFNYLEIYWLTSLKIKLKCFVLLLSYHQAK
jgi:hypothetical protein